MTAMKALHAFLLALAMTPTGLWAANNDQVVIDEDKFSKFVTFRGPAIDHNPLLGTSRNWYIRSWLDRDTGTVEHQLHVMLDYVGDRRVYWRAADDDAVDLRVKRLGDLKLSRHCDFCAYFETIGIDLPERLLRAKAVSGFQIKIYARSGDFVILDVSHKEIAVQLEAIAEYVAHMPAR